MEKLKTALIITGIIVLAGDILDQIGYTGYKRAVKTGLRNDTGIVILSRLDEGETAA